MVSFEQAQIDKTDPSPYHQIFVLSEKVINDALRHMWDNGHVNDPLKSFKIRGFSGSIDGTLGPPRIKLRVTAQNELFYYVTFLTGTLQYWVSEYKPPMKASMKGWSLAFPGKIRHETISKGSPDYSRHSGNLGLNDSAFTISKLYLDATTSSAVYDEAESVIDAKSKKDPVLMERLWELVNHWKSKYSREQRNVLGYFVSKEKSSEFMAVRKTNATFVPTSIQYWTYPWIKPGAPLSSMRDGQPENALCYLTMTGFEEPRGRIGLDYSGPFVQTDATFCMNAHLFWDKWFLPLTRDVVRDTEIVSGIPVLKPSVRKDCVADTAPRYSFGAHKNKPNSYFDWKPQFKNNQHYWEWTGEKTTGHADKRIRGKAEYSSQWAQSSAKLTFDVNGRRIVLSGKSEFQYRHYHNHRTSHYIIGAIVKWSMSIVIQVVNDGGLQASAQEHPQCTITKTPNEYDSGVPLIFSFHPYADNIRKKMLKNIKSTLDKLTNKLNRELKDYHKLTLPAAGVFLMKDARFNRRGDLLASLYYHDYTPPTPPKRDNSDDDGEDLPDNNVRITLPKGHFMLPDHIETGDAFRVLPIKYAELPARVAIVDEDDLEYTLEQPEWLSDEEGLE